MSAVPGLKDLRSSSDPTSNQAQRQQAFSQQRKQKQSAKEPISLATHFNFPTDTTSVAPAMLPTHTEDGARVHKGLRVMVVDDNHINLSILSTLLKRRFSHLLASPPASVDSGLKAIQLMRQSIFDLVLMDIQMPFLDGVECTRRIRAGEDGILPANRGSHIVAVTTAVGEEPEQTYRRIGMDGMIEKPVRVDHLTAFIQPLADEAETAKVNHTRSFSRDHAGDYIDSLTHRLSTVSIQSPSLDSGAHAFSVSFSEVLPPLPLLPVHGEKSFYVHSSAVGDKHIGLPSDMPGPESFEVQLRSQTKESLRMRSRARTVGQSSAPTVPESPAAARSSSRPNLRGSFDSDSDEVSSQAPSLEACGSRSSGSSTSAGTQEEMPNSPDGIRMFIDHDVFDAQIAQELRRHFPSQAPSRAEPVNSAGAAPPPLVPAHLERALVAPKRPALIQRRSSPACVQTADIKEGPGIDIEGEGKCIAFAALIRGRGSFGLPACAESVTRSVHRYLCDASLSDGITAADTQIFRRARASSDESHDHNPSTTGLPVGLNLTLDCAHHRNGSDSTLAPLQMSIAGRRAYTQQMLAGHQNSPSSSSVDSSSGLPQTPSDQVGEQSRGYFVSPKANISAVEALRKLQLLHGQVQHRSLRQ